MTYNIYYDEREIRDLDETVEIVNSEITDVIYNYYNICVEQSTKIKETIKDIQEFQLDNERFRSEIDSEKTNKKFDKWEKTLNEDEYDDACQKYFDKLYEKYPRYVEDQYYHEEEVEKDLSLAYEYQDQNNESLKKLKELMNKLKELKIYIY